jgi:L-rhamnose mutarotase
MERIAFTMRLKAGCAAEYQRRHDALWPELAALLRDAGITDYSIFLEESSLTLFGVLKLTDRAAFTALPQHPLMRRWWAYMADLMETNPDSSPRVGPLREVFHLA